MSILHMETDTVRNVAQQLQGMTDNLTQQVQSLNNSLFTLQSSWFGFSSDMFAEELSQTLLVMQQMADMGWQLSQRVQAEIDEWEGVGRHFGLLLTIFDGFRILDMMKTIGFTPGGGGGGPLPDIITLGDMDGVTGHTEDFLIRGMKIDLATRYRAGEMSFADLIKNLAEMEKSLRPDYVDTDWTLYQISQGEAEGSVAAWQDSFSGKYGKLDVSALSAEAKGSYDVKLGKDGLTAEVEGQVGAYLVHAEYDKEIAGVDVAAEGYIGAQAEGEAELKFNPIAGTAMASIGGSAFVGGRIDASANKEINVAGVKADVGARGSVSYGLGAKFDAEVGMDQGVIKADVDIGATLGLGGEIGFTVELDVQDAAENVVGMGKDALDWIF